MRDNCGIVALDALLKEMKLNMSRISLDTLAKICRDNDRLMFPLKVPKNELKAMPFPYILQTNNHFEIVEEENSLDISDIGEHAYLLYPQLSVEAIPYIIDEEEAKQVLGACNDGVKSIPLIGQYISKPGRLLPLVAGAGSSMLGAPGWLSNLAGTATGLGQAATTGLWGEKGEGSSYLTGGVQGFGQGMLGRGVSSALGTTNLPLVGNRVSASSGFTQPTAWDAFREGFGSSIPFGESLGLYTPGAALLQGSLKAGQITPNQYLSATVGKQGNTLFGPKLGAAIPDKWQVPPSALQQLLGGGVTSGADLANKSRLAGFGFGGAAEEAATAAGKGAEGFSWKQLIPSATLALLGRSQATPEWDIPDAASIYKQLALDKSIPTTFTPEGAAAATALLKNINSPDTILSAQTEPYKQAVVSDLNRRESDEIARVRSWHASNGTSGGSDELRDIQEVQTKYRDYQTQQLGAIEQQLFQTKADIYLSSISTAYQMDKENLQVLAGLTNMSITEAAAKYGMKAQEVKDFRDALYALAGAAFPSESLAAALG